MTLYSKFSIVNTLLIHFQHPNFLSLNTKRNYNNKGIKVLDNAKPIKILEPINDEYISIKNNGNKIIKKKQI